jgi:hypothetical protein
MTVVGSNGYSWSSTISTTNANRLYFDSGHIYPRSAANNRASGMPVRCLQE